MVKQIQEVGSELHAYALGDWEVLLHAQVNVCIPGTDGRTLRRTVAKREHGRRRLEAGLYIEARLSVVVLG